MEYKLYIVEDDIGISTEIKKMAESFGLIVKISEDFQNILM